MTLWLICVWERRDKIGADGVYHFCDTFPDEPALTRLAAYSIVEYHFRQDFRDQDLETGILVFLLGQKE